MLKNSIQMVFVAACVDVWISVVVRDKLLNDVDTSTAIRNKHEHDAVFCEICIVPAAAKIL
jgi:hypothetical protein